MKNLQYDSLYNRSFKCTVLHNYVHSNMLVCLSGQKELSRECLSKRRKVTTTITKPW